MDEEGIGVSIEAALTDPNYATDVPAHVPPELILDFNLYDGSKDPFETYKALFDAGAPDLFWTRHHGGHWIALGAQASFAIAQNAKNFSTARMLVPDSQNFDEPLFLPLQADPPAHGFYRALVQPLFHPRRLALLQQGIHNFTNAAIDDILVRGECEFMADFASQMPVDVFLRLMDLPPDDRLHLLGIAARVFAPDAADGHREAPLQELFDYLTPTIEARFARPGDDIVSEMIRTEIDGRKITPVEMVRLATTILLGGLDSVPAVLGYYARYLAQNPEARRILIEKPEIVPNAVEEILRRFPPTTQGRNVTADTEVKGVQMKTGDHVVWASAMANMDPRRFTDPLAVDFTRRHGTIGSFGNGIHFCLGASLARTELRIFTETWLPRIPDFHIPEGAEIGYRMGINFTLTQVPLKIGPAPAH